MNKQLLQPSDSQIQTGISKFYKLVIAKYNQEQANLTIESTENTLFKYAKISLLKIGLMCCSVK